MKRLLPATAILAFLVLPQAARAQAFDETQLAGVVEVYIALIHNVPNDCLPSPNVLEVEAQLVLGCSA